jgi:hypothetical protein
MLPVSKLDDTYIHCLDAKLTTFIEIKILKDD